MTNERRTKLRSTLAGVVAAPPIMAALRRQPNTVVCDFVLAGHRRPAGLTVSP